MTIVFQQRHFWKWNISCHISLYAMRKWKKRRVQGNFTLCAVIIFQIHQLQKSHTQSIRQSQIQIYRNLKRWSSDTSDASGKRHCDRKFIFPAPFILCSVCTLNLLWECRYKYLILDLHFKPTFQIKCNTAMHSIVSVSFTIKRFEGFIIIIIIIIIIHYFNCHFYLMANVALGLLLHEYQF